jgi:hypothetical protein
MKRITIFGLVTLAVTATLLLAAGGWDDSRNIDPHSHENIPFAVVNKVWGNDTTIYFGELAYGSERYLVVVNSNCDTVIKSNVTETIYLATNPGPGKYAVIGYRTLGDDQDTLTDTVSIDGTHYLDTISFALTRGGSILLHFDPITPDTAYAPLYVDDTTATYYVNGRKIAVDKFGRIHVCYSDLSGSAHSVWYARSNNACTTWQKQKITNNAFCPAIAVDTFGIPWVTYMTYPDMHNICVWSEGFYDTLVSSSELISNAPCIALDFEQGVGVIFYSSRGMTGAKALELPSLKTPSSWYKPPREHFTRAWPLSCCFSDEGDAVATGSVAFSGQLYGQLYRLIQKHPSTLQEDKQGMSTGEHGNPSTARQGSKVWAAYYQGSSNTIRYKKASRSSDGDYLFPGGRGDSITCPAGNYKANSVQLADDFPLVVWSQSSPDGSWRKIYYNYMKTNQTWSDRIRLSLTNAYQLERYPHVVADYDNKKIYIMWTQFPRPSYSGDTLINFKVLTFEDIGWDSVRVINPNGPPRSSNPNMYRIPYYMLGTTINVVWSLKKDDAIKSCIYATYDYPGGSWDSLGTTYGNDTTFEWETKKAGDSCRVKVVAWYPGNKNPYDISDENFRIVDCRIKPFIWPPMEEEEVPSNILSAGGLKTIQWQASSFNGLDTTQLQATVNGGGSFSFVADSCVYDSTLTDTVVSGSDTLYCYEYNGTTYWTASATPTSYGYLRLMAVDTTSDTVYSYDFYPFCIPPPGGFQYNTYSNQEIMSLNDNGDKIGLVYTAQDPDTATKLLVLYMESDEGLGFSAPDTVGPGCWPSFSEGACFWRSAHDPAVCLPDALFYAYQLNDTFATPYPFMVIPLDADSGGFAPVGFTSVNDTVHAIIRTAIATPGSPPDYLSIYSLVTLYAKFPEASPGSCVIDTLQQTTSTSPAGYTIGDYAASVVKRDSMVYGAYDDTVACCFATITPSGNTTTTIGQGSQPSVNCCEGNITYTYLCSGDTSLIRLWRYLDDTTWVERDTFYLDDDAEILCGEEGLMYGVQRSDTSLADLYVYDPISESYPTATT